MARKTDTEGTMQTQGSNIDGSTVNPTVQLQAVKAQLDLLIPETVERVDRIKEAMLVDHEILMMEFSI